MHESIERLIQAALSEDIGAGDLTSRYFVPADRRAAGYIVADLAVCLVQFLRNAVKALKQAVDWK